MLFDGYLVVSTYIHKHTLWVLSMNTPHTSVNTLFTFIYKRYHGSMQSLLSGFLLKDDLMADGNRDWCLSEWNGEARQVFTKTQHFCLDVIPEIFFWCL